jgi:hypothetical protein
VCLLAACETAPRDVAAEKPLLPDEAPTPSSVTDGAAPVMPTPPLVRRPAPPVPAAPRRPVPAAPRRPDIAFIMCETIDGEGKLESAEIDPVLRGLAPEMLRCDERSSVGVPRFQGVLEVRFALSTSGRLTRVVATERAEAPGFSPCVASLLRRARLPTPRAGSVEMLAAYRFAMR